MIGNTLSSNIISILGFLLIIPTGRTRRSKAVDVIGFSGWMILVVGFSAAFVYLGSPMLEFDRRDIYFLSPPPLGKKYNFKIFGGKYDYREKKMGGERRKRWKKGEKRGKNQ